MRTFTSVSRVLIWVVLVVTTAFHALAAIVIEQQDAIRAAQGIAGKHNVAPAWICTVLMIAAVILFFVLRRGKIFPLLAAGAISVYFVWFANWVVGFTKISAFNAAWQHASAVLIPLLMIPLWFAHREQCRIAKAAEEAEEIPTILGND